jgi:hypothetical protein
MRLLRDRRTALFTILFAAIASALAQGQTLPLIRLKAAVLSKLPQFIEWPGGALEARATLDLCVGSPDPFGEELQALVADQTVSGRPLVIRRVEHEEDVDGCHILYLPAGSARSAHPLLHRAQSRPILTVGDDLQFLDQGGIVGLRVVEGRVRFDINAAVAHQVGLRISSQLLRLALSVRGSAS